MVESGGDVGVGENCVVFGDFSEDESSKILKLANNVNSEDPRSSPVYVFGDFSEDECSRNAKRSRERKHGNKTPDSIGNDCQSTVPPVARLLRQISDSAKEGRITKEQKGALKDSLFSGRQSEVEAALRSPKRYDSSARGGESKETKHRGEKDLCSDVDGMAALGHGGFTRYCANDRSGRAPITNNRASNHLEAEASLDGVSVRELFVLPYRSSSAAGARPNSTAAPDLAGPPTGVQPSLRLRRTPSWQRSYPPLGSAEGNAVGESVSAPGGAPAAQRRPREQQLGQWSEAGVDDTDEDDESATKRLEGEEAATSSTWSRRGRRRMWSKTPLLSMGVGRGLIACGLGPASAAAPPNAWDRDATAAAGRGAVAAEAVGSELRLAPGESTTLLVRAGYFVHFKTSDVIKLYEVLHERDGSGGAVAAAAAAEPLHSAGASEGASGRWAQTSPWARARRKAVRAAAGQEGQVELDMCEEQQQQQLQRQHWEGWEDWGEVLQNVKLPGREADRGSGGSSGGAGACGSGSGGSEEASAGSRPAPSRPCPPSASVKKQKKRERRAAAARAHLSSVLPQFVPSPSPPPPTAPPGGSASYSPLCVLVRFEPAPPSALRRLRAGLSEGAKRVLLEPNAGGASEKSEAISFELLQACFGAELHQTEMETRYRSRNSKKIDYVAMVHGKRVGVSVTRAMRFNGGADAFCDDDALSLLHKKLKGLAGARRQVVSADAWDRSLLHCWCDGPHVAAVVQRCYEQLSGDVRGDAIVVLTTSPHMSHIIFNNADEFQAPRGLEEVQQEALKAQRRRWRELTPAHAREQMNRRKPSNRLAYFM